MSKPVYTAAQIKESIANSFKAIADLSPQSEAHRTSDAGGTAYAEMQTWIGRHYENIKHGISSLGEQEGKGAAKKFFSEAHGALGDTAKKILSTFDSDFTTPKTSFVQRFGTKLSHLPETARDMKQAAVGRLHENMSSDSFLGTLLRVTGVTMGATVAFEGFNRLITGNAPQDKDGKTPDEKNVRLHGALQVAMGAAVIGGSLLVQVNGKQAAGRGIG